MASPPSTKSTPASPPAQESPFSSYVSSLSPINPVGGQNGVLADLTVPSPQPVFTSPHINFPRKGNPLRRFQKPGFSEKFPLFVIDDAIHPENAYISGSSLLQSTNQLSSCTQERNKFGASQEQSSNSPSTCVDEFLADPIQVCDKHGEDSQVIQGDPPNCNEEKGDGEKENLPYLQPSQQSDSVNKSTDSSMDNPEMKVTSDLLQASHNNSTATIETTTGICAPDANKGKRVETYVNLASSHLADGDLIGERLSIHANLTNHDKQLKTMVETIYGQLGPDLAMVSTSVPCGGPRSMDLTATNHIPFMPGKKDCVIAYCGRKKPVSSSICCHRLKDVHAKMDVAQGCNCTPQLQSESLPNEYGNHQDVSAAKRCALAYSEIPCDQQEVAQRQRAMRKRLQFEGVENHDMMDWEANSLNFKNQGYRSESPGTPVDFDTMSGSESVALCSNEQLNQLVNQSGNALCKLSLSSHRTSKSHIEALRKSTSVKGNSSMKVLTPSGIGLHLNTIGSSRKKTVNMLCEKDLEALIGKSVSDCHCNTLPDPSNSFSSSSTTLRPSVKPLPCLDNSDYSADGNDHSQLLDDQDVKLPNSASIYRSPLDAEPLDSSLQMKLIDRCMTPCTTKKSPSEDASRTHLSPKKKRKKAPENEGCKRCNCKRSKCLKLYCDCFAAGTYCSEDCACQECFNRAEYQEMVQDTRQHIESRNPLAFAPKVVLRVTEAPKDIGDFKNITPSSARHKRGCNCKKSQCLKKYCECYQAGVGCSLGCRCEGCKNTFGIKGGSGEINDMGYKLLHEIKDKQLVEGDCESDSSCEKSRVEAKRKTLIANQGLTHLSPLTPFQGSDKHDIPESQIPVGYYQSPESGPSALLSDTVSPSCLWSSISNKSYSKAREEEEVSALGHRLETFSAARADPFSPRWDGFPDICNFSPVSNLSPPAGGGSSEAQTRDRKILQMKLFEGSGHLSAGLLWRSSPVTPLPKFGASKSVKEPDSDSGLHYTTEDDTPDVLRDDGSPVKAVTASSPNQKRVSPPAKRLRQSGSSSSPAIKSGRKFILKSVPSFPSLTP